MLSTHVPDRIRLLRWLLPIGLGSLAVAYESGVGRWIHDHIGAPVYFSLDIVFYGTVVPLLTFLVLTRLGQWLDEKERAETQAQASERRLASITAASADAILGLDSDGRIESWNHGAELIFGYRADEIQGQPFTQLFSAGEAAQVEYRWLVERVQHEGFVRGHETACRDVEGRDVAAELTATHLTNAAGQRLGMSIILRDVTDRQRREQEIRRLNINLNAQVAERTRELAEKVEQLARANADLQKLDRMRAEFVSLVSHQIRAPLTNMRGAVERIESTCSQKNGTCIRMLSILTQQVDRLDRLVRDVLNTARIEAGELRLHPEPISVLPIVQQGVEQIRTRTANRSIRLPIKPGLPLVFADRDRVIEVLTNLLDNADKYSPPAGDVVLEARADETEVTLSVRDHGPGLPPDHLQRVFEKYYRADSSDSQAAYGYGLGLYICQRLVEAHGGHIWAENAPGGGAIFSFTLPVAR